MKQTDAITTTDPAQIAVRNDLMNNDLLNQPGPAANEDVRRPRSLRLARIG